MSEAKIALVTGASRGIGKAILHKLGEQGHTVIGTATSENGASNISAALEEAGLKGQGMVLNIGELDSITTCVKAVQDNYGAPQILVNNAGIAKDNLFLRMKEEEWEDVINTNLTGVFRLTKACIKGMVKARWGRIIGISSAVGAIGNAGQANYAATKAAMFGFMKTLAREFASRNITANVVAPGWVETDMVKEFTEEQLAAIKNQIPVARMANPDEIAAAVAYFASEEAAYVTGQTLHVNGGLYMS